MLATELGVRTTGVLSHVSKAFSCWLTSTIPVRDRSSQSAGFTGLGLPPPVPPDPPAPPAPPVPLLELVDVALAPPPELLEVVLAPPPELLELIDVVVVAPSSPPEQPAKRALATNERAVNEKPKPNREID